MELLLLMAVVPVAALVISTALVTSRLWDDGERSTPQAGSLNPRPHAAGRTGVPVPSPAHPVPTGIMAEGAEDRALLVSDYCEALTRWGIGHDLGAVPDSVVIDGPLPVDQSGVLRLPDGWELLFAQTAATEQFLGVRAPTCWAILHLLDQMLLVASTDPTLKAFAAGKILIDEQGPDGTRDYTDIMIPLLMRCPLPDDPAAAEAARAELTLMALGGPIWYPPSASDPDLHLLPATTPSPMVKVLRT